MSNSDQESRSMEMRRQAQLLGLDHLAELRQKLVRDIRFPGTSWFQRPTSEYLQPSLSDQDLNALGIRKLQDLDVDNVAPFDPEPLFFTPYPSDDNVVLAAQVREAQGPLTYGHRDEWKPACSEPSCAGGCGDYHLNSSRRFRWFMQSICPSYYRTRGLIKQTDWHPCWLLCDATDDGFFRGPDQPLQFQQEPRGDGVPYYEYRTQMYFGICQDRRYRPWEDRFESQRLPHMAVAVWDTTRHRSDTLCSEVVAAIHVINYVLRHGRCAQHHTVPVLVYSFHHEEFARITQAHWDGSVLTIRHSRLLDLRGPEPTSDAWLLLRWMLSKPVGLTAYELPQKSDVASVCEPPGALSPVAHQVIDVRA